MNDRCNCKTTVKYIMKCASISEQERQQIFKSFWAMAWGEKKVFIDNQVKFVPTQRHRNRKKENETKRGQSLQYFLRVQEKSHRVCRTMFLNTVGIGRWTILRWKSSFGTWQKSSSKNQVFKDQRIIYA